VEPRPARVAERSPGHATRTGAAGDPGLSATATALGPGHCLRGTAALYRSHTALSTFPHLLSARISSHPIPVTMAFVAQGGGPSNSVSRDGSRTALVVQNAEQRDASAAALLPDLAVGLTPAGTLRLRGAPRNGPHVAWDEHVVDNEGLGRKKSKSTWESIDGWKMYVMLLFQFVASTIGQDGSTSRPTKVPPTRNRIRMMVRRSLVDDVTAIGIMWTGRARATGVESRKISDMEGTTETPTN
jgi:hypothetical protein